MADRPFLLQSEQMSLAGIVVFWNRLGNAASARAACRFALKSQPPAKYFSPGAKRISYGEKNKASANR
jgi:hypothetical protein